MFLATVFIILITLLNIIVYYLRKHQEEGYDERSHSSSSSLSSNQLCRRFSFAEIKSVTHNFDEALVVGKGGFGKVYRGTINNPETNVAIKRLDLGSKQGAPEFWTEIEMLSKFKHSHLVSLIGYCNDHQEMIIVYEYMSSGSLRDHLHKIGGSHFKPFDLSWLQRLKICIGAARGLDYLHTGTSIQQRVIHRDVKSSNILLDENWAAKISDFGLSKIGPANQDCTHVSTHVKGTFGYLDPEYYWTRRVTRKSDVYALGVVLLEVLCGRPALDLKLDDEKHSLARWAKNCIKEGKLDEMIDPSLAGQILPTCLKEFAQVANQCLHNQPKKRPTMAEVVVRLELALSLQERTDFSVLDGPIIEKNISVMEHELVSPRDGGERQEDQSDGYTRSGGSSTQKLTLYPVNDVSLYEMKTLVLPDQHNKAYLDWDKRYKIIAGVAQGLLYLHEDTPFPIIQLDVKASNILWDEEMNPKILDYDFQMPSWPQRIQSLYQQQKKGKKRIQSRDTFVPMMMRYVASECIKGLPFSTTEVHVFSFGVLVLEIVSGLRNEDNSCGITGGTLLRDAWNCWRKGTANFLIDPVLSADSSNVGDIMRCIQIGLLCVQENAEDRPTMGSVVHMLSNSSLMLPELSGFSRGGGTCI